MIKPEPKQRSKSRYLFRLFTITITKRVIIAKIILYQKTSYNLGDLYVNDYDFGG